MSEMLFVFILFTYQGPQYVPANTLEQCIAQRQASMQDNQQYFEPWRYGLCHEMTAKAWEAWYRHEYKLAGTP